MAYTVLARRYRSQSFDEVVGQEAIARTLTNAIAQNRVAHAYLFVGTRGVGKTTMARLFARALAGGSPEVDQLIMAGQDTDVIEIDAASNRDVESARDLIANCGYRPLRGKKKVYIIDEVHMLTRESFNTLLKTLEEPPEHVVFILCTTEAHKVLPTIQSRCQRFDFRNLGAAEIAGHLKAVCKEEKVKADDALLHALGRLGNGSMRDALSILDRLIAAREGSAGLTLELLESVLGLPKRERLGAMVDALASSDAKSALEISDSLLSGGVTGEQLTQSLVEHLRDLLILRTCGDETNLVELTPESRASMVEQARKFDPASLVHMIALCESAARMASMSGTPRAVLDAMLVRLAMTEAVADVAALLSGRGGGAAPGAAAPAPRSAPPKKR
ncbi:MAG TPA: DNA polymerase III subunit gamma/tau [Phycisphaerales bacterium]|nr:DNA polymerase III subunit gamma/tau [Phycisphaerales bacterium]